MINNKKNKTDSIIQAMASYCEQNTESGKHYLCLQDTTEINFHAHHERMAKGARKPGIVSNDQIGCFVHPVLVLDAEKIIPIGFSSVRVWSRPSSKVEKKAKAYKTEPKKKKESYRWTEAAKNTHKRIGKDALVTVISDRESDIYDFLADVPNANTRILIRANQNRTLESEEMLLKETMYLSELKDTYEITITAQGCKKRNALLELRYRKVTIKRPLANKSKVPSVTCYCVLVKESEKTQVEGVPPIEWCLLTTHEVESNEQAMQCVDWYKSRWLVEELFRVLKKDGLCVEDIQLESMNALHKLLLFALQAALQVIALKLSYDKPDEEVSATAHFSPQQVALFHVLLRQYNGKTDKLKNPFKVGSLPWASWILARMGGWDGYKSQAIPGYTTFKKGLDRFYFAWSVYKDLEPEDVYKG